MPGRFRHQPSTHTARVLLQHEKEVKTSKECIMADKTVERVVGAHTAVRVDQHKGIFSTTYKVVNDDTESLIARTGNRAQALDTATKWAKKG